MRPIRPKTNGSSCVIRSNRRGLGATVEEDALAGRRYVEVVAVRVDEAAKGHALDALDGAQL